MSVVYETIQITWVAVRYLLDSRYRDQRNDRLREIEYLDTLSEMLAKLGDALRPRNYSANLVPDLSEAQGQLIWQVKALPDALKIWERQELMGMDDLSVRRLQSELSLVLASVEALSLSDHPDPTEIARREEVLSVVFRSAGMFRAAAITVKTSLKGMGFTDYRQMHERDAASRKRFRRRR